ncbi:MAG: serine protease [Acidobacteriota bacterium]
MHTIRCTRTLAGLTLGLFAFTFNASAENAGQRPAAAPQKIGVVIEKIVGGGPANQGENRWITSLQGGGSHFCGASLIDDRWVLTAAHCVEGEQASGLTVWIGGYNLTVPDQGTTLQVSQIHAHQNYDGNTLVNDIALLELSEDAPSSLPRVKLPTADVMAQSAAPGDMVTVSGWGALSQGGPSPNQLHEVVVPAVSNAQCNAPEAYNGDIVQSMICAGLRSGGKDSCQGDSGGPLWVEHQQEDFLIGIVSFGEGCAQPNKYGVYTRVVSFLDWIQDTKDGSGGSTGGPTDPTQQCTELVCSIDPYCCEVEFDEICEDLASQQCQSGGTGPGQQCTEQVCAIDAYCCEVEFDEICEQIAADECGGGTTGGGGNQQCVDAVCAIDSYCCETEFDEICEQIADDVC